MKSDISGNRSNKSSFVQRLPDGTEIGAQAAGCFTKSLLDWHRTRNDRSLPWKNEKDPYRIWLSEIILQQTRAEQGIPYYLRFIEKYPDVASLAEAADEDVFRLWQGLGYYNRCRNLLVTARYVHNELEGQFPESYEGLLRLKGVGAYTAAAVASFAFGLPQAVLDGNVYRVLSRYFAVDAIPGTTIGRKRFQNLADLCLEPEASGAYNQAIMDLGATICTPLSPGCEQCPLAKRCQARTRGLTELLPVKTKKPQVKNRYFHYLVLLTEDAVWLNRRTGKDIWQNLHEPLLIEHERQLEARQFGSHPVVRDLGLPSGPVFSGHFRQRLTHQLIESSFYTVRLEKPLSLPLQRGRWTPVKELKKLAFPRSILSFLEKNLYF